MSYETHSCYRVKVLQGPQQFIHISSLAGLSLLALIRAVVAASCGAARSFPFSRCLCTVRSCPRLSVSVDVSFLCGLRILVFIFGFARNTFWSCDDARWAWLSLLLRRSLPYRLITVLGTIRDNEARHTHRQKALTLSALTVNCTFAGEALLPFRRNQYGQYETLFQGPVNWVSIAGVERPSFNR